MSIKDIILQGVTPQTHVDELKRMFSNPDIEKAIISVAFATQDGVNQIKDILESIPESSQILIGVSNGITSIQSLQSIFLYSKKLYIVDTGTSGILFHPKIYYIRTKHKISAIIGSANLTLGGLNNNIEASAHIEIKESNKNYTHIYKKIEDSIDNFIIMNPDNIKQISTPNKIEELFSAGLVIDEEVENPIKRIVGEPETKNGIRPKPISLHTRRIFKSIRKKEKKKEETNQNQASSQDKKILSSFTPVWTSKELTRRDLNIPATTNTHLTGSINLDKGSSPLEIDHRHYFKENIFGELNWTRRAKTVVEATATFLLIIKDVYIGDFELKIRHTTSTDTKAYRQKNAMTRLSWGDAKKHVARTDLLGCVLKLSTCVNDPTTFSISID